MLERQEAVDQAIVNIKAIKEAIETHNTNVLILFFRKSNPAHSIQVKEQQNTSPARIDTEYGSTIVKPHPAPSAISRDNITDVAFIYSAAQR